jgi:hypothetical protein
LVLRKQNDAGRRADKQRMGSRRRRLRPTLVEHVSDVKNRRTVRVCCCRLRCENAQTTLEFVDVDVAALQVTTAAVGCEPMASVQHSTVVEADQVAGFQTLFDASWRPVEQACKIRIGSVVFIDDVVVVDVERTFEGRCPVDGNDAIRLGFNDDVRSSVSGKCTSNRQTFR